MQPSSQSTAPPVDLGIISTVLGSIGLILFLLPILAIPIAVCGALSAGIGLLHAMRGGASNPRWAIVGIMVSCAAIGVGLWLAYAPIGVVRSRVVPGSFTETQGHLYISPPATPNG